MSGRFIAVVGALVTVCCAAPAYADPCEAAVPSQAGVQFSGLVRYVGDGDGLCVGRTSDPNEWIEVRLADFDAPELHTPGGPAAKAALERVALRREITCTADMTVQSCEIELTHIGDVAQPDPSGAVFAQPARGEDELCRVPAADLSFDIAK